MTSTTETTVPQCEIDELILNIAKRYFLVETLRVRGTAPLDRHLTAVWDIKDALQAAYDAGVADTRRE